MEERVKKLEEDVGDMKSRLAVAESNIRDMKQDISDIKSNTTWILRLILGAIILAILAFILKSPETNISLGGF
ncbi:hemolysin XhlA family protein [Halobacillus sp. Cin3]|uniref:hemolysin XhlA family protein n=1 Tax=Halobacillus sp. Cin3 TaxID=2928441 RepID=UPI00248F42DB|nr:hemolysin XhlA family protein [Halobacillus sp. Cin3]